MILSGVSGIYGLQVALATAAYAALAWSGWVERQRAAGRVAGPARPARAQVALVAAWFLHGAVILWGLLGGTPRFGFAPALSVTAWLVLTIYAVESQLLPQLKARWTLAGLGALAVALSAIFPGDPLHARASVWLPLHWALGLASYGLFATAVIHAALMTRAERRMRQAAAPSSEPQVPLLTLERITFRLVTAGFVLLTATLLAGWFFGEHIYGHGGGYWKWNHKTVFSVLSWLVFAALLAGRWRLGWRGRRAVRILYAGSALLLLGYVGSRFVLEVILGRTV